MSHASKNKPRLGRGLSSLISVSDLPIEAEVADRPAEPTGVSPAPAAPPVAVVPTELAVADIAANPHQPRKHFDEASIQSLAASIKASGLVQPVIVRPQADSPGKYQLIAGERRLRAAKAAGLASIPAIVRDVNPIEQAQMALVENIQREDLNPIDRAQAYRELMDKLGLTQAELASRVGEDRSSVANYLRLLDLAESVRQMVCDGRLSMGHAKILAGVADPAHQQELAERVLAQALSVRNLERVLEEVEPTPAKVSAVTSEPSAHIRDLEKSLAAQLGYRVQVRGGSKKGKGKLVIHYGSLDQFDALLERLGLKTE